MTNNFLKIVQSGHTVHYPHNECSTKNSHTVWGNNGNKVRELCVAHVIKQSWDIVVVLWSMSSPPTMPVWVQIPLKPRYSFFDKMLLEKNESKLKRGRDGSFCKKAWREHLSIHKDRDRQTRLDANEMFLLNRNSVTRFGEISPLWQKLKCLWPLLKGYFRIWLPFDHILALF